MKKAKWIDWPHSQYHFWTCKHEINVHVKSSMYYKFTFGFKKEPCSNMMSVALFLSIYVSPLCIFLSALVFWNWNDKSFAKNIYWNTHPFYILVLEFKIILSTYYFMKDFFFKILIFFFPTMFKIPWNYHDFTNFSFWKSMKNDQKIIPSWLITLLSI